MQIFHSITFFLINENIVEKARDELKGRFQDGSTVPGTRSFHQCIPQSVNTIAYKRVSNEHQFSGKHSFSGIQMFTPTAIKNMEYVICMYIMMNFGGLVL